MPKAQSLDRLSPGSEIATPLHPRATHDFVRRQLLWIATLVDAGFQTEARGTVADLLFDFQPVIVTDPALLAQCLDVLHRSEATALQHRFLLAAYGDSPRNTARPETARSPG
jgi:hypothetical protein